MKCSIVKGVPFACCFGVAGRMAHLTTCEEVAGLIAAYCTCNESGNTCEHGHLARKCELCMREGDIKELRAEISRLRGVCKLASDTIEAIERDARTRMLLVAHDLAVEGGKEATDGQ